MSQAGESPGDLSQDTSGATAPDDAPDASGPESGGTRQFEEVFDPRRLNAPEGDTDIQLQPDQSDQPAGEGEFNDNPAGNVTVPYNEVFQDYADAANEAMDQSYIPLGLRDVVREYFLSIDTE